jgi:integrase
MDLSRKRDRAALKVRREPHWQKLGKGTFLGYRRGAETWLARYRDSKGKQNFLALDGVAPDDFQGAKEAAEVWFATLGGTAARSPKRSTTKAALETYLAYLRRQGRGDAADEAEGRFKLVVYKDPVANLSLESATRDDFEEWRDRLKLDKVGKPRQPRSINRHVRSVVAGLNKARDLGHIGNPEAWNLSALADDREEDGQTAIFLTPEQRKAIIDAAPATLAAFLKGLESTGARPGELAGATVEAFDGEQLRLQHRKGRPAKLRTRFVVLDVHGGALFRAQARGNLPGASLSPNDGGDKGGNHEGGGAVRAATPAANLHLKGSNRIPPLASAYSFRHARISELLQLHGIDPLTVAQQTGTSVAMIEKSYFRFISSAMQAKLAQVKGAQ